MITRAELWDLAGVPWKSLVLDREMPEVEIPVLPEMPFSASAPDAPVTPRWIVRRFRRAEILDGGVVLYREVR